MTFEFAEVDTRAKICVVGVGGGGGNAVNTMVTENIVGVHFIAANTDMQALDASKADKRIQLGPNKSKGLGAGANPELGRDSAEESIAEIKEALEGAEMVFITAGLGGGTGTGAAPVVARVSRELNALTVAVVTKPFFYEGRARMKKAEKGWEELRRHVDTIITIPNDRLIAMTQKNTSFKDGMKMVDDVLVRAVRGITDLINVPGYINPDFADVKTVMNGMGQALMGTGQGVGENRAAEAVNAAIASPLLQDISIDGAVGVLVNISAREDSLTMVEVSEVMGCISEEVHDDAEIIFGVMYDDTLGEAMQVTVVAAGINSEEKNEVLSTQVPTLGGREPQEGSETVSKISQLPVEPLSDVDAAGEHNPASEGEQRNNPFVNRFSRSRPQFDEDRLDIPTYLRRNEN